MRNLHLNHACSLFHDCIGTSDQSSSEVMSVVANLEDAYHTIKLASVSQKYCGWHLLNCLVLDLVPVQQVSS